MTKAERMALIRARLKKRTATLATWQPRRVKLGHGYVRATGHFVSDFTVPVVLPPPIPLWLRTREDRSRPLISTKRRDEGDSPLTKVAKAMYGWNGMAW